MSNDDIKTAPLPTKEPFMTETRFDVLIPDGEVYVKEEAPY